MAGVTQGLVQQREDRYPIKALANGVALVRGIDEEFCFSSRRHKDSKGERVV